MAKLNLRGAISLTGFTVKVVVQFTRQYGVSSSTARLDARTTVEFVLCENKFVSHEGVLMVKNDQLLRQGGGDPKCTAISILRTSEVLVLSVARPRYW
jgi:hypothetical protein